MRPPHPAFNAGIPRCPLDEADASKLSVGTVQPPDATERIWRCLLRVRTGSRGMRETKPLGSKTQAQAPFRPKGTFGLSVATFADSFLLRIRQRTSPSGRQGGQSASRLSHLRCSTSLAQRTGHPGYREPRPVQMGVVVARWHLSPFAFFRSASSPSVCVIGARETQRECFKPFGFTRSVASFVTG